MKHRSFSNGAAVDSVETQKSRIVLHELEDGWWILASIDLTQLPAAASTANKNDSSSTDQGVEYSSREVSPPALLRQQLTRAYNVFLLHHGSSLKGLFEKLQRPKFCNILSTFWSRFANNWDVLLHGSPAADIFGGMKLAAGGELGMGVGEEEWGSGEREVLEDYARRTHGLVDVMVSRFGEPSPLQYPKDPANPRALPNAPELESWIGSGKSVNADDGVVFSGVGALSRRSLRDMSHWVESIYCYGDHAYGVRDNPTSDRRKRRRRNVEPPSSGRASPEAKKAPSRTNSADLVPKLDSDPPRIPPPIVTAVEDSLDKASAAAAGTAAKTDKKRLSMMASLGDAETWMRYATLGYGSAWGGGKKAQLDEATPNEVLVAQRDPSPEPTLRSIEPEPDIVEDKLNTQVQQENSGYFVIGLKGNMGDEDFDDSNDEGAWNNRIPLRTVYVELSNDQLPETPSPEFEEEPSWEKALSLKDSTGGTVLKRLRPVIYVVGLFRNLHPLIFQSNVKIASPVHIHIPIPPRHRNTHPCNLLPQPTHILFSSAPTS
jgi:hypothetical protein